MTIEPALERGLPVRKQSVEPEIARLTERMVRQDELAYAEFFELYFKRLLCYLLVLTGGNEDRAKEALQLTFLRVARYIRKFPNDASFWGWLTVLARSGLIDEARKQKRYFAFLERYFPKAPAQTGDEEHDPFLELGEVLERHLGALPAEEQWLIRQKYFAEKSVKELATALAGC